MMGMNASTGRAISGFAHLEQSIGKIISTPLASCVMRRHFGSELPDLIDAPSNGAVRTRLSAAVATALMRWEPRLTLKRVTLTADDRRAAESVLHLDIEDWATESGEAVAARVSAVNESPA